MQNDQSGRRRSRIIAVDIPAMSRSRQAPRDGSVHASADVPAPVEVLGRAALTAALAADGLEVARPERDIGVDLLAFTRAPWMAVPLQMKAATGEVFSVQRKYEPIEHLIMVYVWNVGQLGKAEFYAMTWREALAIAEELGWTRTASWQEQGWYSNHRPSERVKAAIEQHQMLPGCWRQLVGRREGLP
jgi:hypothetical protein